MLYLRGHSLQFMVPPLLSWRMEFQHEPHQLMPCQPMDNVMSMCQPHVIQWHPMWKNLTLFQQNLNSVSHLKESEIELRQSLNGYLLVPGVLETIIIIKTWKPEEGRYLCFDSLSRSLSELIFFCLNYCSRCSFLGVPINFLCFSTRQKRTEMDSLRLGIAPFFSSLLSVYSSLPGSGQLAWLCMR